MATEVLVNSGGLFITGTDTGVGKTATVAAIGIALQAAGRRVVPFKPAQTGWQDGVTADALFVQRVLSNGEPLDAVCPYRLARPLAPAIAARLEGTEVDVEQIVDAFESLRARYDTVLVEGAGGLLVELRDGYTMAGLAARLNLPLVVVARPGLGTLNHMALTVEAARRRALPIAGLVISGFPTQPGLAERTNPAELVRMTNLPLLGVLPYDLELDVESGRAGGIHSWAVDALAPELGGHFNQERFLAGLRA